MNTLNAAFLLEHPARQSPSRLFLIAGEARLTYGEVDKQARRFANALAGMSVGAGNHPEPRYGSSDPLGAFSGGCVPGIVESIDALCNRGPGAEV